MTSSNLSRRTFLAASASLVSAAAGGGVMSGLIGAQAKPPSLLRPRHTSFEFISGKPTQKVFSYIENGAAPILRAKQNQPFQVTLDNALPEPTTVHWHGIRLPNAMDGVPFLTQPYVYEGDKFNYAFTPPDAGTYWYHPHCNSLVQMSRGLAGLLIVDETKDPGFDTDLALNLRDWRLGRNGQFIKLYKPRKTARGGTHGTIRTANWRQNPVYDAPAGSLLRLRLCVSDVTRIYRLGIKGAQARIIALDGNPVPVPVALDKWPIAPGQRMDLAIRMPDEEGKTVALWNYGSNRPWIIAKLRAVGTSARRSLRELAPLPPNPVEEADLKSAQVIPLEFTATAEQIAKSQFCGTLGYSFWAINAKPWPGVSSDPLAPLAELKFGKSYIFSLLNRTPHSHPIHLHGMSFRILRSNLRKLPPLVTDTVLLLPDEQVQVALKADNPGDWLLHCHVIEHQKTGMSGFIRVV